MFLKCKVAINCDSKKCFIITIPSLEECLIFMDFKLKGGEKRHFEGFALKLLQQNQTKVILLLFPGLVWHPKMCSHNYTSGVKSDLYCCIKKRSVVLILNNNGPNIEP